jgi:hypothetical protein
MEIARVKNSADVGPISLRAVSENHDAVFMKRAAESYRFLIPAGAPSQNDTRDPSGVPTSQFHQW